MKVAFVYCVFENLGVEYLSAVLKRAGHETALVFDPRLFDFASKLYSNRLLGRIFGMRDRLLKRLMRMNPGLVCFSVVSADYQWALSFAADIKKIMDVPVVFGGIHPTSTPDLCIKNEQVDYVIVGEGEEALLDLVKGLEKGFVDPATPNLWLKADGEIIGNKPRPLDADLDALPFADKDLFHNIGPPFDIGHMAMARRGCHGSCSYCGNSVRRKLYFSDEYPDYRVAPGYVRRRSVDNMLAEIKWAREKYGVSIIRYNDDDFAESEEWLEEYRDKAKGDLRVPYKCFVNASSITERAARLLEDSGCRQIQMGVQSLNPKVSKIIFRQRGNAHIEEAIEYLGKTSIDVMTDNMFGLPGEEPEDYHKLVEFYLEHPVDYLNVYWLVYFPRADIVRLAIDMGHMSEETARQMEINPYKGDINRRTPLHPKSLMKMKNLYEIYNHMPKEITKFFMDHKIHKFLPALNLFYPLRVAKVFKRVRRGEFPRPRTGYELVWLRHRRLMRHWIPKALLGT